MSNQGGNLFQRKFWEIDLNDPFFNSLKEDYLGFEKWFHKKSYEEAIVQYDSNNMLEAFLYLKEENSEVIDIEPKLPSAKHLKVGTFKIDAHNTKLGERFVKIILDYAIDNGFVDIYVTIFKKHDGLINLLKKYGFELHGSKNDEIVLLKKFDAFTGDMCKDYPLISTRGKNKYVLSVYPKYHTPLFPDSILSNENRDRFNIINDTSYTNSIHKIYVCSMKNALTLKNGDILVIYRTNDKLGPARYRSVATSICLVDG